MTAATATSNSNQLAIAMLTERKAHRYGGPRNSQSLEKPADMRAHPFVKPEPVKP